MRVVVDRLRRLVSRAFPQVRGPLILCPRRDMHLMHMDRERGVPARVRSGARPAGRLARLLVPAGGWGSGGSLGGRRSRAWVPPAGVDRVSVVHPGTSMTRMPHATYH